MCVHPIEGGVTFVSCAAWNRLQAPCDLEQDKLLEEGSVDAIRSTQKYTGIHTKD